MGDPVLASPRLEGTMERRTVIGCLLAALSLSGCSDKVENAVEAAKSLAAMGEQAQKMGEAAKKASDEAREQAERDVPEGATPEQARKQVEAASGLAALQAMGAAAGTGPVVNWRALAAFVPESVGGFAKDGELDGSTKSTAGMQVTQVERKYKAGEQRLEISITDANLIAMMKMPFAMIAMINEDSTRGFKKGKRVADSPAIVEWDERSKRSKLLVLVGDRYVVNIDIRNASSNDAAEKLAAELDLSGLAKLKAEAE